MYDLTTLIVISLCLLVAGLAGGYYIGRFTGTGRKAVELESELKNSQDDLDSYKEQVYAEFGETAKKFERLQDTYSELHAQLAKSAESLCDGKLAGSLLAAPVVTKALEAEVSAPEDTVSEDTEPTAEEETVTEDVMPEPEPMEPAIDEEAMEETEASAMTPAETQPQESAEEAQEEQAEMVTEALEPEAVDELLDRQTDSVVTKADFGKKDAA
ncbi:MAG: DUF1043 family protein [Pseudomonadota bacterium]